ncbi:rhodanese-like domain-containing protein [Clostridium sp.]|uniref:sulfurtransferase n=1 Tax=Clostridium sp. TaxID=1506 RepID=UPI003216DD95
MRKKTLLLAMSLMLTTTILLVGCGKKEEAKSETNPSTGSQVEEKVSFKGKYIVDVSYVKESLEKKNLLLIDARGEETAKKGTIQGAMAMTWQSIAKVEDSKAGDEMWGTILEQEKLSEKLSNLGIDKDKEIILFAGSQNGWGDDGRILWELVAAGYDNVKMVDGGYDAMVAAGLPFVKEIVTPEKVEVKIEDIDDTHLINTDGLKKEYDNVKVVDVRADEEYKGKTLYGEAKGGHLPGAIHIKYTDLFNEDGTLKSNDDLTKIFETSGLSKDDKIVTYCTAGIRSAYMQLILEMCGFEDSLNYDESYYRWCAVEEVEK